MKKKSIQRYPQIGFVFCWLLLVQTNTLRAEISTPANPDSVTPVMNPAKPLPIVYEKEMNQSEPKKRSVFDPVYPPEKDFKKIIQEKIDALQKKKASPFAPPTIKEILGAPSQKILRATADLRDSMVADIPRVTEKVQTGHPWQPLLQLALFQAIDNNLKLIQKSDSLELENFWQPRLGFSWEAGANNRLKAYYLARIARYQIYPLSNAVIHGLQIFWKDRPLYFIQFNSDGKINLGSPEAWPPNSKTSRRLSGKESVDLDLFPGHLFFAKVNLNVLGDDERTVTQRSYDYIDLFTSSHLFGRLIPRSFFYLRGDYGTEINQVRDEHWVYTGGGLGFLFINLFQILNGKIELNYPVIYEKFTAVTEKGLIGEVVRLEAQFEKILLAFVSEVGYRKTYPTEIIWADEEPKRWDFLNAFNNPYVHYHRLGGGAQFKLWNILELRAEGERREISDPGQIRTDEQNVFFVNSRWQGQSLFYLAVGYQYIQNYSNFTSFEYKEQRVILNTGVNWDGKK